jgi:hypothetical protein
MPMDDDGDRESRLYNKKWVANYAVNGLSVCKDLHCLFGDKKIMRGSLRIGRRYPSPFDAESIAINWFHAKCMFHQQTRSRAGTQIIGALNDIDGVDDLLLADQELIEELIEGNIELIAQPQEGIETNGNSASSTPGVAVRAESKKKKSATKSERRVSINRRDAGRVLML